MANLAWDNLRDQKCPRCGSEMALEAPKLVCTADRDPQCHFSVHEERARNIVEYGQSYHQKPPMKRVRLKWQLLHENRCPACATDLRDLNGKGKLTCQTEQCDFIINENRLEEVVVDPDHAANLYRGNAYGRDIQRNLEILGANDVT